MQANIKGLLEGHRQASQLNFTKLRRDPRKRSSQLHEVHGIETTITQRSSQPHELHEVETGPPEKVVSTLRLAGWMDGWPAASLLTL